MTRTDIMQPFSSKFAEGLTMFFKCLLDLCSPTFQTGLSYISVTTQKPKDDCAFFYMLYLENYNGRDQKMDIEIDKVS
jgi:hypothetical protein